MSAVGIGAFVVALLVSVMLHEAGHFVTARRYGMKATHFFVGFGPTLWSRRRGETEFGLKAIPAGGFVKIIGMTSLEEVDPADAPRAFFRQSGKARAVVLAAGSFMHFIIALVLVYGVVLATGFPHTAQNRVFSVGTCVPATATAGCTGADRISPARAVGLQPGDDIISLNATPVTNWEVFTQRIRDHGPGPVILVVRRGQQTLTLTPTLATAQRDARTGEVGTSAVGFLGVSGPGSRTVSYNPISAVGETLSVFGLELRGTYDVFAHKLSSVTSLYSPNRDPAGFVGVVGAARISGDVFSQQGQPFTQDVANFILIIAGLNLFIGIFNLLPLLPLDGGHLAIVGFEEARHRLTRRRRVRLLVGAGSGRSDAERAAVDAPIRRVDYNKVMPAAFATVALLVVFVVAVLGADIVNPIRLGP